MTVLGWTNYYRYLRSDNKLKELDGWIRRKLRVVKLKQLKRRYTVANFICAMESMSIKRE